MKINDWEFLEHYNYTKTHSHYMWAWEFIRRGPLYQKCFNDVLEIFKTDKKQKLYKLVVPISVKDIDGCISSHNNFALQNASYEKCLPIEMFWLEYWINPQTNYPTNLLYLDTRFLTPPIVIRERDDLAYRQLTGLTNQTPINSMIVTIDLQRSINDQIKIIEKQAMKAQKNLMSYGKDKCLNEATFKPKSYTITHKRISDWITYLRVLDADEAEIRRAKASSIIFKNQSKNIDHLKAWNETLRQAKNFRDEGFFKLI